jgi:hypothetical protein
MVGRSATLGSEDSALGEEAVKEELMRWKYYIVYQIFREGMMSRI